MDQVALLAHTNDYTNRVGKSNVWISSQYQNCDVVFWFYIYVFTSIKTFRISSKKLKWLFTILNNDSLSLKTDPFCTPHTVHSFSYENENRYILISMKFVSTGPIDQPPPDWHLTGYLKFCRWSTDISLNESAWFFFLNHWHLLLRS